MCVGGRRISFPISPQLNKLWYNKNPQPLSSKSKLGRDYALQKISETSVNHCLRSFTTGTVVVV